MEQQKPQQGEQQPSRPQDPPAEDSREQVRNREDVDREEIDIEDDVDTDLNSIEGSE